MKRVLLLFAVLLVTLPTAVAQNRDNVAREYVLFELFTGVHCPYCPAAANGVAQMMEEGLAIAPVAYHTTAFSTELYYTNETKVMEHQCEGSSSLDLSQQQKGLYLLKAQNGTEEYNTKIVLR